MCSAVSASEIIQKLQLETHIEGGFYRRTYANSSTIILGESTRFLMTSIYYMLSKDSPIGYFHQNKSDIVHYYHDGDPIRYYCLANDGSLTTHILGRNLNQGQQLQLVVSAGNWKASELLGENYALISEAVTPGFNFEDQQLATPALFCQLFPQHYTKLQHLIKQ